MKTNLPPNHPTTTWKTAAAQTTLPQDREQQALRLRLAAMAGHLLTDRVAARRAARATDLTFSKPVGVQPECRRRALCYDSEQRKLT